MSKPNFIIFLTDDQGYGDLSCMGATDFSTPNLDQMAERGVRFTDWYSNSPVCSPSRASLLTGRYPGNAGVRAILDGHRTATGLPTEVPTIASALKESGYYTAMSGKWHLGLAEGSRPHDHGFTDWFGFMAGCIDYYSHIYYWEMNKDGKSQYHDLWENGKGIRRNGEYFTELITEYAIKYIRRSLELDKPFLLYIPYNAPHYPMHAPEKYLERFPNLKWDRQIMAAMLSAMDDSVGKIIDELKKHGVGSFTWLNGATYSGEWLNSKPDGQGEMVYSNGEKYTGEFKDGIIHGKGTYSFPDGQRHVGEFKDGLIHGPGIQTTPDGKTLIGIWENGKLQKEN